MTQAELQIHLEVFDNKRRQLFNEFLSTHCTHVDETGGGVDITPIEDLYNETSDPRIEEACEAIMEYVKAGEEA